MSFAIYEPLLINKMINKTQYDFNHILNYYKSVKLYSITEKN